MEGATGVQWIEVKENERLGGTVPGPTNLGDVVVPKTLSVKEDDLDYFERVAAFWNSLADARKQTLQRRWSAKSVVETKIAAAADGLRADFRAMVEAVGPVPPAKDKKAMAVYAAKVAAWEERKERSQK